MAKEKRVKIENKVLNNKMLGRNYADIIIDTIKSSPVEGMTIQGMKDIQVELDDLEAVKDNTEIELTEKSFKHVLKIFPLIPFQVYSKELIDFSDYIESLDDSKE